MLDDTERERGRAAAEREGVDPEELLAEVEALRAEAPPAPSAPKLFQYHVPFLRVGELRRAIAAAFPGGLPTTEDDQMWTGEFLAKHGGVTGATPTTPSEVPA